MKTETNILKIGVCEGRHDMPVDGYIFEGGLSPEEITNPDALYERAVTALVYLASAYPRIDDLLSVGYDDIPIRRNNCRIQLYATGLTVAVLAAVKAAQALYLPLEVMHYDRESGEYFPQRF